MGEIFIIYRIFVMFFDLYNRLNNVKYCRN